MPRPVYVLCCESMTIDNVTGLPSYINVYDTVTIGYLPIGPGTISPPPSELTKIRVSALWALNPDEQLNRKYEHQFWFRGPDGFTSPPFPITPFQFDKPFYRADVFVRGQPFTLTGIYYLESRLREIGQAQWITQDFPLRVEMVQPNIDLTPDPPPNP